MRRALPFLVSVLLALGLSGCGHQATTSESQNPANPPEPAAWQARLEAASAIMNPMTRDESLGTLASDAASHGMDQVVLEALRKMSNPLTKDDAAQDCAMKLAAAGKPGAANQVAGTMMNPINRDEVLAKLAKASGR